jgi:hypothetical protein
MVLEQNKHYTMPTALEYVAKVLLCDLIYNRSPGRHLPIKRVRTSPKGQEHKVTPPKELGMPPCGGVDHLLVNAIWCRARVIHRRA